MNAHLDNKHGHTNRKCQLSDFNEKFQLDSKKDGEEQSKELCSNCGEYLFPSQMILHRKENCRLRKKCEICLKYVVNITSHHRQIHQKVTETCDICGKILSKGRSMISHKEVHNKEECQKCGKFITRTDRLRGRHLKHCEQRRLIKKISEKYNSVLIDLS